MNNTTSQMESITNIKSSFELNSLDGNNDLFVTGYNSLLMINGTRSARDYYLLLMVYINYFCYPVLSFVLNGLCRLGRYVRSKFNKRADLVCKEIFFFVEDKEYISKLLTLQKEQVELNFISNNIYCKTVSL